MIVDADTVKTYYATSYHGIDISQFLGWTYIVFNFELAYLVDSSGTNIVSWMSKSLAQDDWIYMSKTFFFKNESDATMFSLKWL